MYKQTSAGKPSHLKALDNLTTAITTMRFNHDSQLLAIASRDKADQMRMVRVGRGLCLYKYRTKTWLKVHMPSLTVFSNWPTSGTPLGHVTSVDFSASSDYVAIGNNKGRVLLYQLGHYRNSR